METPVQKDLTVLNKTLTGWLYGKWPEASDLSLSEITTPTGSGASAETFLFDATWKEHGERREQGLLVRVKPTGHRFFLEENFEDQHRVLLQLHERGAPVPRILWVEDDSSVLGSPFWVMEKIDGVVPADFPRYNSAGFVFDATPEDRRRMWESALDTFARLHNTDHGDLSFLNREGRGDSGLEQLMDLWRESLEWATAGDPNPVAEETLSWLVQNMPTPPPTSLSWGDSRVGNMIFRDFECQAVLDWEMVSLAGPLTDLGYWLFMEDFEYAPRLPGTLSRADTLKIFEEKTGISTADIDWYEIFAGFRLIALMLRVRSVWKSEGLPVEPADERINKFVEAVAGFKGR